MILLVASAWIGEALQWHARDRKRKGIKKPHMEVGVDIDDHGRDSAFLDVRGRGARTMIEKAMMDEVQLWLVADGRSRVDVLVPLACPSIAAS